MIYFYKKINSNYYVIGKCSSIENDQYYIDAGYQIIESDINCNNIYVNNDNKPIWQIIDGKIINNPLVITSEEEEEKEKNEKIKNVKSQILDKIIDDAINNPDNNNPIKVWINEIINQ